MHSHATVKSGGPLCAVLHSRTVFVGGAVLGYVAMPVPIVCFIIFILCLFVYLPLTHVRKQRRNDGGQVRGGGGLETSTKTKRINQLPNMALTFNCDKQVELRNK